VLLVAASATGSWKKIAPKAGVWGDPKTANREKGELILNEAAEGIIRTIDKIEKSFQSRKV
jgi:creatinine amidohydrolase/Fe(II)-dependent formamide hydrolase-like protein